MRTARSDEILVSFFSIPHDFDALVGQNHQRVVQTRRIHPNLVVADPFEDQHDFPPRPDGRGLLIEAGRRWRNSDIVRRASSRVRRSVAGRRWLVVKVEIASPFGRDAAAMRGHR
jgi:hypothetical protein